MSMQQMQDTKRNQSGSASVTKGDQSRGALAHLRGLTYDQQLAALSPNGGAGNAKEDPEGGLPPEIVALNLKHVTVEIKDGAWAKLEPGEQANVLTFLLAKEAYAKKNKKVKSYKVTIGVDKIENQSDEELEKIDSKALVGNDRMAAGKGPKGAGNREGYIGVEKGDPEVTRTVKPAPDPVSQTFDSESTFPSAKYKPEDMNNAAFNKTLEQAAALMASLREKFGGDVTLKFTVESGESLVTPPGGMATGDLARLRGETAVAQAKKYFTDQGIDIENVTFATENKIGTTPYKPGDDKHDPRYTKEQFLRVRIEMTGQGEPEYDESTEWDAEMVYLNSTASVKPTRQKTTKNRTKTKRRRKTSNKKGAVSCPVF